MTWILALLIMGLMGIIAALGWVVFALLDRLKQANDTLVQAARETFNNGVSLQAAVPGQTQAILDALGTFIKGHNESFDATVKTVLAPVSSMGVVVGGNQGNAGYNMPVMSVGTPDEATWDPTDALDSGKSPGDWPPPMYGRTDPGYEFEAEPGFDPNNPLGIPGLTTPTPL